MHQEISNCVDLYTEIVSKTGVWIRAFILLLHNRDKKLRKVECFTEDGLREGSIAAVRDHALKGLLVNEPQDYGRGTAALWRKHARLISNAVNRDFLKLFSSNLAQCMSHTIKVTVEVPASLGDAGGLAMSEQVQEDAAKLRMALLRELQDNGVMSTSNPPESVKPGIEKINEIFQVLGYNCKGWFRKFQDLKLTDPNLARYVGLFYHLLHYAQDCDPHAASPQWFP